MELDIYSMMLLRDIWQRPGKTCAYYAKKYEPKNLGIYRRLEVMLKEGYIEQITYGDYISPVLRLTKKGVDVIDE